MKKLSELLNSFLDLFTLASKGFQKIFRAIQYFCKKYRHAFPSREQLSEMTRYSIRTVTRATNYFSKVGWIAKKKCGYGSNSYFMADDLIHLDTRNSKIFQRFFSSENVTLDGTILHTNSEYKDSYLQEPKKEPKNNFKPNKPILHVVQIKALSPKEQQDLSNTCTEYQLTHAIEDAKWYRSQGNKIYNWGGWLWKAAQKYL